MRIKIMSSFRSLQLALSFINCENIVGRFSTIYYKHQGFGNWIF
uniref:Uncharacterized protein n=1 Tax=Lepeophtheirus salmonis TaxID=72036 RepID=A0A0K2VIE0_LEPSM